jgi:hypothetical protein
MPEDWLGKKVLEKIKTPGRRILQPLPGTRSYMRLLSEGRLLAPDWWLRRLTLRRIAAAPVELVERLVLRFKKTLRKKNLCSLPLDGGGLGWG